MFWYQWVIAAGLAWSVLVVGWLRINYVTSNRTRKRWNHGK